MITLETIKALKPCKDRLDNYVKHYSEKSFTHGQFMGLKNITPEDKIWVALRLIPQAKLRFAAADIAESVLDIYEAKYPNDNRPRLAIEAARNGSADDAHAAAAHDAAYAAAAHDAAHAAYAAFAAAHAAYAARAARAARAAYAARAARAARAAYAARAARAAHDAYAAAAAARACGAKPNHEKVIRKIILRYWK
jgi:hypothetical protein